MNRKTDLLEYPPDIETARRIQDKWNKKYSQNKWKEETSFVKIAAVDISYNKHVSNFGVACAVLWDMQANKIISSSFASGTIDFPYKPGLLAFREGKLSAAAIEELNEKPDLVIFDGHGFLHPKNFGEAIHIGYALDIPSFGVAKSPFFVYIDYKSMAKSRGNSLIIEENNQILGKAIILADKRSPVFISKGHRISLDSACQVAQKLTKNHKQPEPLYLADHLSKKELKKIKALELP